MATLPTKADVVALVEGGVPVEGFVEVPSSSWALDPTDDAAEVNEAQVVSELGP